MRSIKIIIAFIFIFSSCKKSQVVQDNYFVAFSAVLNGAGAVPANGSSASGNAAATYNKSTGILKVNVTWAGTTATRVEIQKASAGVMGTTVFILTGTTSPLDYTSLVLDSTKNADLLLNRYYLNIRSAGYPNGEIRGQLIRQ